MRITSDISHNINNKIISLNSKLLYLDTEYNDIYYMSYIDNKLLEDDSIILEIKDKFLPFNMIKYFGSKSNLNCNETRIIYNNMIEYFITLLLDRLYNITNIDINNISNENNNYICIIAECTNIIRSSIKKYSRLRTHKNEIFCSKNKLEKRNSIKYNCNYPILNTNYCPSFKYLINKGKTCKAILESSQRSSNGYSIASKFIRTKYSNNKSRHHISIPNNYMPLKIITNKSKTRKIRKLHTDSF